MFLFDSIFVSFSTIKSSLLFWSFCHGLVAGKYVGAPNTVDPTGKDEGAAGDRESFLSLLML